MIQLLHFPQQFKENRGFFRFQQGLFQFSRNTFSGKMPKIHSAAQGNGFLCCTKAEPGSKLCRPQHPQGILCKGLIINMTKNTSLQVSHTAEVIYDLSGEDILHQSVAGKVPAAGGGLGTNEGVHKNIKILMANTPRFFFPGHGDIQIVTFQSENAEALADCYPMTKTVQNHFQRFWGNSMDLNIHILVILMDQGVPDKTAYIEGASTLGCYQTGDLLCHLQIVPMGHIIHPSLTCILSVHFTESQKGSQVFIILQMQR